VHDALLIEGPASEIEDAVTVTRKAMSEASAAVLGGMQIATDVKVVSYPDRYSDPRGEVMWTRVNDLLDMREVDDMREVRDMQ
jgi:hypothetical protein